MWLFYCEEAYRPPHSRITTRHQSGRYCGTTNTSGINWRPCVCRCRSTSVEQFTASPPLNLQIVFFLQTKNLSRFFLDSHSGYDNVNFDYVKRSGNSSYRTIALIKLYILITLPYIRLLLLYNVYNKLSIHPSSEAFYRLAQKSKPLPND